MVKREQVQGVTIDSPTTRDIDDAIWVEKDESGWLVTVSIADVAREVRIASEDDVRAKEMTETRYYARGNSPMLPRPLSEDQLSLWPHKFKKTMSVELRLNEDLSVKSTRVFRSVVRSQAKGTYEEVPGILADKEHKFHPLLERCSRLAMGLLTKRRDGGAFVLYDLNTGWVTTEEGFLRQLEKHDATIGYIIIQELMVLANGAVAAWCVENNIPILFRNHVARAATPPDRAALMQQIQDAMHTPLAGLDLIRQQTHMLLARAEYGAYLRGHYGLNLPAYTHFTSPIRRYADLVNQRQIRAFLKGEKLPYEQSEIEALATHINEVTERERAATAEYLKSKADEKAQRVTSARRIDGLGSKDFERVVKLEARSGAEVSGAFHEAYLLRLKDNRMPLVCMTVLFTEAPQALPGWTELRKEVVAHVFERPEVAVSLFTMATQISNWPAVTYDVSGTGPSHAPQFTVVATIEIPDRPPVRATSKEGNQKVARQKATAMLLANLAGVDLSPIALQDYAPVPQAPAKKKEFKFDQSKDPISVLMEYCQANSIDAPIYTFEQSGPSHIPTIVCTCEVAGVKKSGTAGKKQDAKRIAAVAAIGALSKSP